MWRGGNNPSAQLPGAMRHGPHPGVRRAGRAQGHHRGRGRRRATRRRDPLLGHHRELARAAPVPRREVLGALPEGRVHLRGRALRLRDLPRPLRARADLPSRRPLAHPAAPGRPGQERPPRRHGLGQARPRRRAYRRVGPRQGPRGDARPGPARGTPPAETSGWRGSESRASSSSTP